MSVFKATKNRSDSAGKFKATEKRSYDSSLVSQWETSSKESYDVLEKYRQRINSGGFLSSDDLTAYRSALDTYKESASNLRRISKSLGQGAAEDDDQWNESLSQMESGYKGISDYYSQWKNEADFKVAMEQVKANEKRMAELTGGYDPAKNQQEGKAGWEAYMAQQEKYAQMNQEAMSAQEDPKWWEQLLKYIGDIGSDTSLPGIGGSQVAAMSKEAQQKDLSLRSPDERWTDEQRETFGYLWNTERQKANEYAFAINSMLNKQEEEAKIKGIQESATDNFAAGAVHTLGAIAASPLGLADYLGDLIYQGAVGYVPQADGEITPFEYSQAVTGGVSQHLNEVGGTLNENIPVIGGKGWGDVYGLGTSIAQSSLAAYSGGSGQALITFFGSAAASGVDDALSRGASGEQAVAYGTLSGLAEGLAENIGVDNLLSIGASNTMRQLVMNILKQGAAEGLEEGATTLMNNFADQLVLQDKSNFSALVQRHMLMGLSESDAKKQAWMDMANDLAFDMVSGFASGAIHAGPQTAYQTYLTGNEMKANYGGSQQELVGEALEIDPNNAFAQKMQGRLDRGKSLSGNQLSELVAQNNATMTAQDRQTIQNATVQRLTEVGVTENVDAIANALTKQAMGEKLTISEKLLVKDYHFIAEEMNPKNIREGKHFAEWSQKIGTQYINANEYGKLLEDAQLSQEDAETPGEEVAPAYEETAQAQQDEPVDAAEQEVTVSKMESVAEESLETEEEPVTLEEAAKKYGAQAGAMIHTYTAGQDVAAYDKAYQAAYDMGKSGVSFDYIQKSQTTSYLTDSQKELAYEAGKAASSTEAQALAVENKEAANGKTGRKKGVVRGEGVKIADLKKTFNDPQGKAYKYLSTVAEVTGIDIVLYKSEAGPEGDFQGAQGRYSRSKPGTIYIDLNAGLSNIGSAEELAKYSMLRTFAHEFTHFIENWNPVQYNEFRKVVFDTLTQRGENVHDLIEEKQARNLGMEYEAASREVVAEAMTDILPDVNFVQELAQKHKNIFTKLLEKLKEFVANLREYFDTIGHNTSKEANALKEQVGEAVKYVDSIVNLFDKVAVEAVENYQQTVAVDEVTGETSIVETKAETTIEEASPEVEESETEVAVSKTETTTTEMEEVPFDRRTLSLLKAANRVGTVKIDGQHYVTNGFLMLPTTGAGVKYAHLELDAITMDQAMIQRTFADTNNLITKAPIEANIGGFPIYEFTAGKKKLHFDKKLFSFIDGGMLYYKEINQGSLIKSVNEDGSIRGYLLSMKLQKGAILTDQKPSKLKSFSKKMQALIDAQAEPADTVTKPAHTVTEPPKTVSKQEETGTQTPSEKLAFKLLESYLTVENINRTGKALTSKELYALADEAFGGTQAEGAYNRKDAYDAMELAVNKFLLQQATKAHKTFNGNAISAVSTVEFMQDMLDLLPTQNVRTQEMEDFQQFSTPPNIAYLAAWAANITGKDMVLEPSAGIGGLAVFAKAWGAEVAVNELSKRRLEVLRAMGFDHLFNENAEQIDNILPENISPSVVIMNPPFSSTAGRTANNKTSNAEKHIDQALARLRDGGRLVAVLGKSMNDQDYYRYWDKLRKDFNIRANLSIDGSNYKKYGTTWGVQIVVIDKTGPQTGETVTGRFTDLTEIPNVLEGIRNDRRSMEENRPASSDNSIRQPMADGGNGQSDTGHQRSSEGSSGSSADHQRKKNRKSTDADPGTGDRTDNKAAEKTGTSQVERQDGGRDRTAGRADAGNGDGTAEPGAVDRPQPEQPLQQLTEPEAVSDDGVYATFIAPEIPVQGGKKHPAVLVESAAMAAVSMPKATYKPSLPADVVKNNLSDAQLVTVTYAGQAHEQKLPDGRRKGFFVGDGTGVGKGRQIAGIILDNFMQGRTKAVWISKNNDLYGDAIRDWTATTGRSKDEVISHSRIKPKDKISLQEGILYSTYDTIKSEKGGNRLDQIVEWLGKDYDGVIAFDEAHNMGNLFGKKGKFGKSKGSEKARAGVELQRRLPNARIVYVSATAATEVDNLAYAERIGLWGQGTAFSTAQDFISKIGASGLAAMELVIRDMKAMGTYVARSISYNGVNYDTVEHSLDPMQTEIYNTMSRAWQKTMSNVQSALETTGGQYNSTERQKALGNFYSSMQRFYNQVLTSMSMPSVIADMRKEIAAGHSCVLQIVNTNEAQQNKQLAEAKASGESLDNLDLTPREALVGYLTNSFPTQMFEEYTDEDGNLRSRPVMDSTGNPVQNKAAIRQRDALIEEVNQMSIPDGPLEMLFDAFGPDAVAENTGRSRRVVPRKQADGTITRVEERRTLNHRTADVQAFQDGKKRILVFSDAGGTGKSYHADRTEKNQQLRIHYVLQPGWVASNAVQGFGRTHRSNEASAPIYKLVTTNIKGQKRFTSTIARRLDQLGALTKGQRDTGSGMFGAKDNLETDLAKDSLREFYKRLGKNQIEGVDGMKTLDRLGLKQKFTDEFGAFKVNDNLARDIGTFLNRILALEVDEQNVVFDAFISIYEMELEAAIQAGTLDTGMENVKADRIEVVDDKVIREDKNTGAATHYIQAKTFTKPKVVTTVAEMQNRRAGFEGIYKTETGAIKAVYRIADKTTEWGAIQKQYRLVGPNQGAKNSVWGEMTLKEKAQAIDKADWQKEWDAEVARVPEYNEDTMHMLTGALLPIWNSLPQEGNTKVKRLIAHDGSTYLGRVIDKDLIDGVLKGFSIGRTKEVFTAKQVMDKALDNGIRFYLTNDKVQIFRSKVSGQWRLEIMQPYNSWFLTKRYPGIIQERISYRDRYFIPVGEKGVAILEKLLADNPVRNTTDDSEQYQSRAYLSDEAEEFRSDIDGWDRNGRPAGETFILGSTGDVLQGLGAIESDVYVQGDKINTIFQDHPEMTIKEIKNIPEILENPVLVMASRNQNRGNRNNNRLTIFGMVKAQNGLPVMVAFDLHPVENKLYLSDMQKVVSAYTKDNSPTAAMKLVQNSEVLYADKEKTAALLHSIGFQMPKELLRNGYVGSISYEGTDVNIQGIKYSELYPADEQNQQRTNTLTDREVLAIAANQIVVDDLTDAERSALFIFQQRLSRLEDLQTKRAEQGQLYKEQQFGAKVDRAAAAETLNRMRVLDSQIQKASAEVLSVEEKTVLKRVLQKARKVVEQQERQHGQEILKRWRDRRDNAAAIKKYRDRIRGDVDELTNWVLHPDNKSVVKHIPDALKNTVIPFLSSINFMSKRQLKGGNATAADKAFMDQLRRLEKVMDNTADVDEMYSNYTDLPPDFMKNLHRFMDTAQGIIENSNGEFVINQMTSEELQELSKVVRTLKKYIMQMNRFHVNAMFQHVYEAGDNSIDFLGQMKPAENTGAVSQFLLWQQIRPAYAFERFGKGGEAIYDGLRRGQATLAFNTKKIKAFSDRAYTVKEVNDWENQVKTIRIGPGKTVTMRVSQIMSLYELNKREQARGHILGEGIRVATFKNGKQKISDVGQHLTPGELNMILRELTPRQKEVADNLQQFMQKQGGEWGNHVTVARFGEKQFGEDNYFPINSDGRHLSVDADEKPGAAALYALLNMGFTKQTQEKAKNRIVVYSIFDVFANHMASMAQYNAFALPVVDALKWFNYQQKSEPDENGYRTILGSVREQMDRVYGVPEENRPGSGRRGYAQNFVINIIKAFNGTEAQGTPNDTLGLQTLHHYNRAQVAYNFRVVVQQPLAITRAAMLLDYASIMKGMKLSPAAIQKNVQEMQSYSGIAAWKSLGFYDVNISRGLTSIIKHDDTVLDKINDVGMWGAEKADLWTWAAIWSASKEEVIRKQHLTPKSEGFYEAVTKLFEDVIYKTQVVDSVLTKNEFMRDKGFFARAVGSFMSEPSATASMLVDAYDKYHMDMQRGMNRQQAWKKNSHMIVRTAYVYGLGAAILAAVQAVADAMRDDDDYQEWYEKWLEAFGGNLVDELMPVNKLPIVSDFYELAKELLSVMGVDTYGNPPQSVFMQWYDSLVKGVEILYDKVSGANTSYTWYGGAYKLLQAASGMTGLPMASATREIVTAWNNIVGGMAPSLKVKTYEPSEKSQIKYAYQDGYLTEDEAVELLLKHGIAKNEREARKTVQGW